MEVKCVWSAEKLLCIKYPSIVNKSASAFIAQVPPPSLRRSGRRCDTTVIPIGPKVWSRWEVGRRLAPKHLRGWRWEGGSEGGKGAEFHFKTSNFSVDFICPPKLHKTSQQSVSRASSRRERRPPPRSAAASQRKEKSGHGVDSPGPLHLFFLLCRSIFFLLRIIS